MNQKGIMLFVSLALIALIFIVGTIFLSLGMGAVETSFLQILHKKAEFGSISGLNYVVPRILSDFANSRLYNENSHAFGKIAYSQQINLGRENKEVTIFFDEFERKNFVTVKIFDCNAKLNINQLTVPKYSEQMKRVLNNLGEILNVEVPLLGEYIIDKIPEKGFSTMSELRKSIDSKVYNRIKDFVTVFSYIDDRVVYPVPLEQRYSDDIIPKIKEGNHLISFKQLEPTRIDFAKRSPININIASKEVLFSVIKDLNGYYIDFADIRREKFRPKGLAGQPYTPSPFPIGRIKKTPQITGIQALTIAEKIIEQRRRLPFTDYEQLKKFFLDLYEKYGIITKQQSYILIANFLPYSDFVFIEPSFDSFMIDKLGLINYSSEFSLLPHGYFEINSASQIQSKTRGQILAKYYGIYFIHLYDIKKYRTQSDFVNGILEDNTDETVKTRNAKKLELYPEVYTNPANLNVGNFTGYIGFANIEEKINEDGLTYEAHFSKDLNAERGSGNLKALQDREGLPYISPEGILVDTYRTLRIDMWGKFHNEKKQGDNNLSLYRQVSQNEEPTPNEHRNSPNSSSSSSEPGKPLINVVTNACVDLPSWAVPITCRLKAKGERAIICDEIGDKNAIQKDSDPVEILLPQMSKDTSVYDKISKITRGELLKVLEQTSFAKMSFFPKLKNSVKFICFDLTACCTMCYFYIIKEGDKFKMCEITMRGTSEDFAKVLSLLQTKVGDHKIIEDIKNLCKSSCGGLPPIPPPPRESPPGPPVRTPPPRESPQPEEPPSWDPTFEGTILYWIKPFWNYQKRGYYLVSMGRSERSVFEIADAYNQQSQNQDMVMNPKLIPKYFYQFDSSTNTVFANPFDFTGFQDFYVAILPQYFSFKTNSFIRFYFNKGRGIKIYPPFKKEIEFSLNRKDLSELTGNWNFIGFSWKLAEQELKKMFSITLNGKLLKGRFTNFSDDGKFQEVIDLTKPIQKGIRFGEIDWRGYGALDKILHDPWAWGFLGLDAIIDEIFIFNRKLDDLESISDKIYKRGRYINVNRASYTTQQLQFANPVNVLGFNLGVSIPSKQKFNIKVALLTGKTLEETGNEEYFNKDVLLFNDKIIIEPIRIRITFEKIHKEKALYDTPKLYYLHLFYKDIGVPIYTILETYEKAE